MAILIYVQFMDTLNYAETQYADYLKVQRCTKMESTLNIDDLRKLQQAFHVS